MKGVTPLQWAVFFAYAHSLSAGPERDRVRALSVSGRPSRCGPALVLAAQMGLTCGGRITPDGATAARRYLAQRGGA